MFNVTLPRLTTIHVPSLTRGTFARHLVTVVLVALMLVPAPGQDAAVDAKPRSHTARAKAEHSRPNASHNGKKADRKAKKQAKAKKKHKKAKASKKKRDGGSSGKNGKKKHKKHSNNRKNNSTRNKDRRNKAKKQSKAASVSGGTELASAPQQMMDGSAVDATETSPVEDLNSENSEAFQDIPAPPAPDATDSIKDEEILAEAPEQTAPEIGDVEKVETPATDSATDEHASEPARGVSDSGDHGQADSTEPVTDEGSQPTPDASPTSPEVPVTPEAVVTPEPELPAEAASPTEETSPVEQVSTPEPILEPQPEVIPPAAPEDAPAVPAVVTDPIVLPADEPAGMPVEDTRDEADAPVVETSEEQHDDLGTHPVVTPESESDAPEASQPTDVTPTAEPAPTEEVSPVPAPASTPEPAAAADATEGDASVAEAPVAEEPVATPENEAAAEPALAAEITVEAMSSNDQLMPGQIREYHFRVVNSGDAATTVRFSVANILPGWTGRVVHVDGSMPESDVTIEPGQNIRVVVEVGAPRDSKSGDRNTTELIAEQITAA